MGGIGEDLWEETLTAEGRGGHRICNSPRLTQVLLPVLLGLQKCFSKEKGATFPKNPSAKEGIEILSLSLGMRCDTRHL